MQRRTFLHLGLATRLGLNAPHIAWSRSRLKQRPQVVVVGGGFGGATAAKYIRQWSQGWVQVTLVEPMSVFTSCPMSNMVVTGFRTLQDITTPYTSLTQTYGVQHIQALAKAIDIDKRQVHLANSGKGQHTLTYDKLVLSPGIDLMHTSIESLTEANASQRTLQAWKAGPDTLKLQQQLRAMADGGTYLISIPLAPYRCPPGPYERASVVAAYLKTYKPRSKVIVLDANPDIVSKPKLFKAAWQEHYPTLLEYRPNHKVVRVDPNSGMVYTEFDEPIQADILNILPDMRAGQIATVSYTHLTLPTTYC
jgi:sulfide dehydrogenase [flavocytochrome c] flavoprotein subunit